jgi:hypothetical protein
MESSTNLLIDLAHPGEVFLNADDFKVLKDGASILAICRNTLERLKPYLEDKDQPKTKVKKWLLEVPIDTEVFARLYGGSACYLYVPGPLYPKAIEKL